MSNNRLFFVLILIAINSFFDGLKSDLLIKFILTSFLLLAVAVCIINYAGNYDLIRSRFNRTGRHLIQLLLLLNLTIIIRGLLRADATLTTALGNPYNALALLAPFVVGFAGWANSLYTVNRFLLLSMIVGLVSIGISFILGGLDYFITIVSSGWLLVHPMVFLIGAIGYFGRMTNYAIMAGSIILVWNIGFVFGSRATVLRVISLFFLRYLKLLPLNISANFVFPLVLVGLAIFAFQAISTAITVEESFFQVVTNYLQDFAGNGIIKIAEKSDTRTFLYVEVISDLMLTGELWLGRGSSGTYFSHYFLETGDDSYNRLTVEVGFLAYLLKGGIFAAALNIIIFVYSAYLSVYKSNNHYMRWVGFMLIVHVFILFFENLLALDLYNLCIWLFVGFCLSNNLRTLNNNEIKLLFPRNIWRNSVKR
jgi:hypothetical protein